MAWDHTYCCVESELASFPVCLHVHVSTVPVCGCPNKQRPQRLGQDSTALVVGDVVWMFDAVCLMLTQTQIASTSSRCRVADVSPPHIMVGRTMGLSMLPRLLLFTPADEWHMNVPSI